MRLRVLWTGKTREEWVRTGIEEYAGRIRRYMPLELAEAREEKGGDPELMRRMETERLAKLIPPASRLVLMDERGDEMTSPQFASFIGKTRDEGVGELVFVVGGAYGFGDELRRRAHRSISLSRMTFTHQMVRVFLLEQIYRGFTILNGEPYHH